MGNADLVAFGRQSLADPHTPQKAMEERLLFIVQMNHMNFMEN